MYKVHSNFSLICLLNTTGTRESSAKTISKIMLFIENASVDDVNLFNVCPACIATNEGGATPKNVPSTKGHMGTPTTGLARFMNQLGSSGVILKNSI